MSIPQDPLEYQLRATMDRLSGLASHWDVMQYLPALLYLKHLDDQRRVGGIADALPEEFQWDRIRRSANPCHELTEAVHTLQIGPAHREIGELLDLTGLQELEKKPRLCRELIEAVSGIDLRSTENQDAVALQGKLVQGWVESLGVRSGEVYTPENLSLLMAELLAPEPGSTIYDPTCGTGSLLIAAYRQSLKGTNEDVEPRLFGQEINRQTAALARMNMHLNGLASASIAVGNTLLDPRFLEKERIQQFDYIIAHPPVGYRLSQRDVHYLMDDPHYRFIRFTGAVPRVADYAFIQHVVVSLKEHGRAALLIGLRPLFVSGREGEIRKALIEADLIESVVTLPPNLLPNTSAPTAVLILNKAKPSNLRRRILLVHANEQYELDHRGRYVISEEGRQTIVQAVRQREGRIAAIASREEIEANDFVLIPARYMDLISIDSFMGGAFQWLELGETAEILPGTRFRGQGSDAGATPIIQGRDLSVVGLKVDDLATLAVPSDLAKPVYSKAGDVLLQRIGQKPSALLVEEDLEGALVKDTVYVIRMREQDRSLGRYLVEFFNSDVGHSLLSTVVGGATIPTLRLTDLRRLRIPVPRQDVIKLVTDLHEVEQALLDRINHARDLRKRLFGIEDPDQVTPQLRSLNVEAQALAVSLVQVDDFDFQVRNFYPFPLAYAYRTLSAIRDSAELYREQLRVAENLLAFLGSVGLALAIHTEALSTPENTNLTDAYVADCWAAGISPGHWQALGRQTGAILRSSQELAILSAFASLWFRGSGRKESGFARDTKELVELKNDFKHDRGPKIPYEYDEAAKHMEELLRQCLEQLGFFIQYPIRLVQHMDRDWQTEKVILDTLLYVGDHPGLRKQRVSLTDMLSKDLLYLELTDTEWASLYPLISVQYCPDCRFWETYFIDRWDGPGGRTVLKSFERGHTHDNDDVARTVDGHLQHWLRTRFCNTLSM